MRKALLFISLALLWSVTNAKLTHILPLPQKVQITGNKVFRLHRAISVSSDFQSYALQQFFKSEGCTIQENTKVSIKIEKVATPLNIPVPKEYYKLQICPNNILIQACDTLGILRAVQTLRQIAEGYKNKSALETCIIEDFPAYSIRGFMIDIGRTYIDFEELKKIATNLAKFKVNVLHLHLTENQAWRLECKIYPQLNDPQFHTRQNGKFYTQEQMLELEGLCRSTGMDIIPEIDIPGHSAAFERAMGFPMQSAKGIDALKKLLTELTTVFRHAPYIHFGGDETILTYPSLPNEIIEHIHHLGYKAMAWNRGCFKLEGSGVDLTQMWATRGTAIASLHNVDSRYSYINHTDVFADLVSLYTSNIYYTQSETPQISGELVCLWTDHFLPTDKDIISQNNLYAAVLARNERAWRGGGTSYIEKCGTMIPQEDTSQFKEFVDWERRFLFHKSHTLKDEPIPYVKQTNIRWCITDAFPNEGNKNAVFPPETEGMKSSYNYLGKTYHTSEAIGAAIYLRHTWGSVIPAFYENPLPNHTAYAYTYIYSPIKQDVGAFIEFQCYSRSDADRSPDNGEWDRRGSRIWLNEKELLPPAWTTAGRIVSHEEFLGNENFTARPPYPISLEKGWNKVLIKLPYLKNNDGIRLQKWMFTFVLVDKEGRNALENIEYHTQMSR